MNEDQNWNQDYELGLYCVKSDDLSKGLLEGNPCVMSYLFNTEKEFITSGVCIDILRENVGKTKISILLHIQ